MLDHHLLSDTDALEEYGVSPDFYEVPRAGVRMVNHKPVPIYFVTDIVRLWTDTEGTV